MTHSETIYETAMRKKHMLWLHQGSREVGRAPAILDLFENKDGD